MLNNDNIVKLLIKAGSLIQARYPIEAGFHLMMLLKT